MLANQEAERQRLAKELHDGPLQELHSLDFALVVIARMLADEQAKEQWSHMRTVLQTAARQIRTLCQDLRPPALEPFGLGVVLRSLAENFQQRYPQLKVELDVTEDGQRLPHLYRITFYRICQQALRNIAQHANAQRVSIILRLQESQVIMTISDDGCGFSAPAALLELAQEGRFGLFDCFQRAAAIEGKFAVETAPGHGVRLSLTAPLLADEPGTNGD